ncbi:monovalent cation:proton antiporter-2 (CPA2) family protein [Arenimonas sp.]|uniref:monovalent cation:proton antiporter-2 (CPA2) family protein n=1 Tax=Arenimonas sp. TaxID=1872635 RepID=UPI0035B00B1A
MHGNGGYLGIILVFLVAAVVAVPLFRRLGLGAILGYLAAGVAIGPDGLKLVPDPEDVLAASEFGVVMLLFIIGLELSPPRLWVMRRQVFGTGGLQVLLSALAIGLACTLVADSWKAPFVIGMGLALSSTAVGLQLLAERKELASDHGRVAFAILLFQDLVAIPLLAAIPLLGAAKALERSVPPLDSVVTAVAAILAVVVGGRFLLRHLLRVVARAKSVEVFTASALLVVVGNAWLMQKAGLSMGLGAFLAGVLLAESEFRHELESHIEPFKGLFLGLFFIAIGMSIDLNVIADEPALIAGGVLALLLAKTLILVAVGRFAGGLPLRSALMLGAVLAMGGEFGFVVFAEALKAGLFDAAMRDKLFVVIGLSMAATPLAMMAVARWLREHPEVAAARAPDPIDHEHPRVIIAGFGRVGQIVGRMLRAQKIPFTALENSAEQVDFSRRFGNKIYFGDPARPELLRAAHAERAEVFVLTTDDPDANVRTARLVKRMYPHLKVYARARNRQHAFKLMDMDVDVTRETFHSSLAMGRKVMEALGVPPDEAARNTDRFRQHDEALLRRQHLVYDDEAALVASSHEALRDLETLFEADTTPEPGEGEDTGEGQPPR